MTLDDLFSALQQKGGRFVIGSGGIIREERSWCCPLEWAAGVRAGMSAYAAEQLGVAVNTASALIAAADNYRADPAVRARLLALYGLTERQT